MDIQCTFSLTNLKYNLESQIKKWKSVRFFLRNRKPENRNLIDFVNDEIIDLEFKYKNLIGGFYIKKASSYKYRLTNNLKNPNSI